MRITIDEKNAGRQIKYILSGDMQLSGNTIKRLKATGGILLNGKAVKVIERVCAGDEVEIVLPVDTSKMKFSHLLPEVLFEDDDIIVVNKPGNMPSHPSIGHEEDTLANAFDFMPRIITRLDKDTTGVVLVCKNPVAAHRLSCDMKNGRIKKEYAAVVCGKMKDKSGIIDAPIARGEGIKRVVSQDGKNAVTYFEVIEESDKLSLLRLMPITGRTHQIRVHLSYVGNPIYGDWLYGDAAEGRCRLHARKIEFTHPMTGEKMIIEAQMPEDMINLC